MLIIQKKKYFNFLHEKEQIVRDLLLLLDYPTIHILISNSI